MSSTPPIELPAGQQLQPPFSFCPLCAGHLIKRQLKALEPMRLVCSRCAFVYYLDPKVAAGTVTLYQGQIVLVKRSISPGYGQWVIPGGFVDRGETVEEAAIRETLEETGLQVKLTSLINVYSYPGRTVIIIAYLAETLAGVPAACDEALEVGLFNLEDIPWGDLAFSSTRDALKDYGRRLQTAKS